MLTKHSGVQAGDEQGKARNAAAVARLVLKVTCERGSVPDVHSCGTSQSKECVISAFAGLKVVYQYK